MKQLKIIAIRHGETDWNTEGRLQGHLNSPLTPQGREQARRMSLRLQSEQIECVYSSDLGRCQQTSEILFSQQSIPVIYTEELRERNHGIFAGYTVQELPIKYPLEYDLYKQQGAFYTPPHGESGANRFSRIKKFIQTLTEKHENSCIALVTHGGGVDSLFRMTLNLGDDYHRNYKIPNLAYNLFVFKGAKWHLECWADTSHLQGLTALDDTR